MAKKQYLKASEALQKHAVGTKNYENDESLQLHTRKTTYPKLVTSPISETLDDEKANKKAAEICARKLEKVFLNLEKEYPWQKNLDVYEDENWRKAINELLKRGNWKVDKSTELIWYLQVKLWNLWYETKRSWPWYFTDSLYGERWAWLTMSRKAKVEENN